MRWRTIRTGRDEPERGELEGGGGDASPERAGEGSCDGAESREHRECVLC